MKRRILLVCSLVCFLSLFFMGVALAGEYKLSVPHHSQKELNWCGIAVAQSWIQYLTGTEYTQIYLYTLYPETWNGVSAGNLKDILEDRTGKGFQVNDHKSESSAFKKIREELKEQKRPIAFAGNACKANGTPKTPAKHWMIIEGLNTDKTNKIFQGAYVDDPLYGSPVASGYETIRPRTWVKDLFTKWWLPKNGLRQTVDD